MKNILLTLLLIICACQEPTHTKEIVEVQVPMDSHRYFTVISNAHWDNPYSDVSNVVYQMIVCYVGADSLTGKVVSVRGWLWDADALTMVDSTAYNFSDTTVWQPYNYKIAEYFSDNFFLTGGTYEFWGGSVEVSK